MRMNKKCQGGGGQLAANSIQMPFNSLTLNFVYKEWLILLN